MAKVKSKWICQQCGYESAGYLGKCPECGSWSSFVEEVQTTFKPQNISPQGITNASKPSLIKDIQIGYEVRVSTNISEFDRILGGGFVEGSLVLLAGDPGIGKSTITLQTCGELCKNGKKVLTAGNGGSAGDAQHIAGELVSKFFFDRPGLSAFSLATDTSILTAIGNDYGYEKSFSRQIQANANEGDVFIAISTSGNSENIVNALVEAKKKNVTTIE